MLTWIAPHRDGFAVFISREKSMDMFLVKTLEAAEIIKGRLDAMAEMHLFNQPYEG
jgi:hypothetical protein